MENRQHVLEQDDHDSGTWVLITNGGARILGRVHKINHVELEKNEVAIEKVTSADVITLLPNYDFFSPLRPVQARGPDGKPLFDSPGVPTIAMQRDPIVTTRDFAMKPYPVHIKNGPGVTFDFINQMHEDDRKTYRSFADAARESALKHRASQANLVLPDGDAVTAIGRRHGRG